MARRNRPGRVETHASLEVEIALMDIRLAKHFLRRLRHRLEADAIDHAVERGILVERLGTVSGRKMRAFAPGPLASGKSGAEIAILLRHQGHAGFGTSRSDDEWTDFGDMVVAADAADTSADGDREGFVSVPDPASVASGDTLAITELMRLVRQSAETPRPEAVATLLLVAQSLRMSATSLDEILRILREPRPIITITSRVTGFEQAFLDLFEDNFILPGKVATCAGYGLTRRANGFRFSTVSGPRWRIIVFSGEERPTVSDKTAERQVGLAALSPYPILGIADDEDRLPRSLMRAARINLSCGPITMPVIRETMRAVLGEISEGGITWQLCEALTIADLALAIRPGVPVGRILDLLEEMAKARIASAEAASDEASGSGSDKEKTSTVAIKKAGRGDPGSGSEHIRPAALKGADKDRIPRVETLSGYGDARAWALGLKDDLKLWQAGSLAWEEMSTRLLLSGPPGTGKTLFARAVCNTLQVSLFATSVATWLEPGYLGDVLKRMTTAFREAEAASPSILFIDEIDGLGTRSSGKDWSEYHNSTINRILELLDGATKASGVIVIGATNRPEAIDRAVLRSGRLETHIVIPQPNTETLVGILEHHLGADLDAVIASAPPEATGDIKDSDGSPTSSPDETVLDPVDADFEKAVAAKPVPDRKDPDADAGYRNARSEAASSRPLKDSQNDTV
jgi:hypothetical protein